MIYLFTGSNGSGKTLNSIKFICEELNPADDRPVFFYAPETQPIGIAEAGVLDWQSIDIETCREWYELPEGSIILVDEFRHVWPWRNHKDQIPQSVDRLAEHRSKGFDFVLTAQKPASQFDPAIQGFIEEHRHLEGVKGSKKSRHYIYQSFCSSPLNPPKMQHPEQETHSFDSKYFKYYRSASIHTHKDRLPYKKLIPIVLAVILIPGLFMFAWSTLTNDEGPKDSYASADYLPAGLGSFNNSKVVTVDEYIDMNSPRIDGLPYTAPVYDELMKPVVAPKPAACIIFLENMNKCSCYTQQATPLEVPYNVCVAIANNGWFDHSIEPVEQEDKQKFEPVSTKEKPPRSVLISDSRKSQRQASAQAQPRRAANHQLPLNSSKHFNNRNSF